MIYKKLATETVAWKKFGPISLRTETISWDNQLF